VVVLVVEEVDDVDDEVVETLPEYVMSGNLSSYDSTCSVEASTVIEAAIKTTTRTANTPTPSERLTPSSP
jgi:hypothetical protein